MLGIQSRALFIHSGKHSANGTTSPAPVNILNYKFNFFSSFLFIFSSLIAIFFQSMLINSFFLESSKLANLLAEDYFIVFLISVRVPLISNAGKALFFNNLPKNLAFHFITFSYYLVSQISVFSSDFCFCCTDFFRLHFANFLWFS